MNQDMCLFSQPMTLGKPDIGWSSSRTAPFGLTTNWNVALRGGDSSNPEMLLIGNQLVLASHNLWFQGGPDYAVQVNAINQQMHYLSTNNNVGTDYQLTQFPMTNWPSNSVKLNGMGNHSPISEKRQPTKNAHACLSRTTHQCSRHTCRSEDGAGRGC